MAIQFNPNALNAFSNVNFGADDAIAKDVVDSTIELDAENDKKSVNGFIDINAI